MTEASEKDEVHYNPRIVPKPPEELQRLIFPFIEICKIEIIDLDASDKILTDCALLKFMDRGRTLLLQDVTQLIKFVCIHILFDHEVFKTKLSLNFKETLGTL